MNHPASPLLLSHRDQNTLTNWAQTSCIPLFLQASDHAEDLSIHPLFHEHASERLHQPTNPILGPIGEVVVQHPLVSHSLRPKRARVADGRGLVANGS